MLLFTKEGFNKTCIKKVSDYTLEILNKEELNDFIDFINKLDQKIKEDARVNALNWFNL